MFYFSIVFPSKFHHCIDKFYYIIYIISFQCNYFRSQNLGATLKPEICDDKHLKPVYFFYIFSLKHIENKTHSNTKTFVLVSYASKDRFSKVYLYL